MMEKVEGNAPPLFVRATINLPGVKLGEVVEADADSDYVRRCIATGYLVPVAPIVRAG